MELELTKEALKIFDESYSAEDRISFLEQKCHNNPKLQQEIASLLETENSSYSFLNEPLLQPPEQADIRLKEGDTIGRYRILRQLADGGMSSVYLAVRDEPGFNVQVAIKIIDSGSGGVEVVSRFLKEHEFLAKLDHPNIAKAFDRGTTNQGHTYLVMEYVEGDPIDRYCDSHQLTIRKRLELFKKVCHAVHFAHQNLIVHRDLKPGNILVTAQGEPKLLDFGIAHLIEPSPYSTNTEVLRQPTRGFIGTLRYASPEQVRSDELITTSSDVYSLGTLLYVILTGHHPFQKSSSSFLDLVNAICRHEPDKPSVIIGLCEEIRTFDGSCVSLTPEDISATRRDDLRNLRRSLSGDLDRIVLKALSKRPEDRYGSAQELSEDIDRHLNGLPVAAREPTFLYQLSKFFRRHTGPVITAAGMILMITVFAFVALWLLQREQNAHHETEQALFVSDYLVDAFKVRNPAGEGTDISARDLLDQTAPKLEILAEISDLPQEQQDELASQLPADLPGLMNAIGWAYYGLGSYKQATEWLTNSVVRREDAANPLDRRHLVVSQLRLSAALEALGHHQEALLLREKALQSLRDYDLDNLRIATRLNEMAIRVEDRGALEFAAELFEQAVAMKRRLLAEDDISIAVGLNNLASIRVNLGHYEEAESAFRESLEIKQGLYSDPSALERTWNNLATVLREMGALYPERSNAMWAEAEELFRKSLASRRASYDATDPRIATVLNNLALLLLLRDDLEKAQTLFGEALQIFIDSQGPNDFSVGVVLRNRATLWQALGRFAAAERDARQALEILRSSLGEEHWRIADAKSVLGGVLLDMKRVDEAASLLKDSLPILVELKGEHTVATWEAEQRLQRLAKVRAETAGADPVAE